jgi:hypothetical protein
MSSDSSSVSLKQQERIDSPSKFTIYSNSVELGISPWDVRMVLMEILGQSENVVQSRVHGTVTMAPAHAKMFMEALKTTIQKYEDAYGEIDVSKIKEAITTTVAK